MRVAYILPVFSGVKRLTIHDKNVANDASFYLNWHLDQLENLEHNLDTIFVVINEAEDEPQNFTNYIEQLHKVKNTYIQVLRRPNEGISYGAYKEIFEFYVDFFDYFILVEDDYVPYVDNFDQILIDLIEEDHLTTFMCSYVSGGYGPDAASIHAAISNGIVRSSYVKKVLDGDGFNISNEWHGGGPLGANQVVFSQSFLPYGEIRDYGHKYLAPYWNVDHLDYFHPNHWQPLIVPYQYTLLPPEGENHDTWHTGHKRA